MKIVINKSQKKVIIPQFDYISLEYDLTMWTHFKKSKFIQYKQLNLFNISVNIFIADAKQSMVVAP